ncbi:MAG: DUF3134 domain-containing protein [Cyanobacteria bacterium SID2]|nr:DUF3134 domain-containing protein [Cyanobacteria bacterium SID2]MBP0002713.1 DUF3134 domain-containing protein [Cyanobacteria bacterium SBC]
MNDPINPSLRQIPRNEPAELIPANRETSLLEWLKVTGRLIPRDNDESAAPKEDEEFIGLMSDEEDNSYDESDSDDLDGDL